MPPLTLWLNYNTIIITSLLFLQQNGDFMKKYLDILKRTTLFSGISENDIEIMRVNTFSDRENTLTSFLCCLMAVFTYNQLITGATEVLSQR